MPDVYDFSAMIYDPLLYLFLRPVRQVVLDELRPYKRKAIVDLCCGTGNQLKLLAENGFSDLHCLDLSPAMLRVAKKGDYPLKIYHQDATQTGFDPHSFDVVTISFAIHEKDRKIQEALIQEARRLLKRDGVLLIVDFVFDEETSLLAKLGIGLIERMAGGDHYRNFRGYIQRNGLDSLINADRFDLVKNRRLGLNGVTVSQYHVKKA